MANINPMVAVAKQLLRRSPEVGYHIHYCVYHSQYPIAVRSEIEKRLDAALTRHDPEAIWLQPEIRKALADHPEDNQLFVVLATPVAEVGRDHDYDWAIAEPSSMRSLIQLAGRVQRHRRQIPKKPNILILSRNYCALRKKPTAYTRPGFELGDSRSHPFHLFSHDLYDILESNQFQTITSIPRIDPRDPLTPMKNLVDLEHGHLDAKLFGFKDCAALWWRHSAHWSFELQRRSPFRESQPEEEYALYFNEEGEVPKFHRIEDDGNLKSDDKKFEREPLEPTERVSFWGDNDIVRIVEKLAESMDMDLAKASQRFGQLELREKDSNWFYHKNLGIYDSPN
jgi:CRISPR-associated endonuclease/helicase Cas3